MSVRPCQTIPDGTCLDEYPNTTPVWLLLQEGLVRIVPLTLDETTPLSDRNEDGG
jgi:hypothetical protein